MSQKHYCMCQCVSRCTYKLPSQRDLILIFYNMDLQVTVKTGVEFDAATFASWYGPASSNGDSTLPIMLFSSVILLDLLFLVNSHA